MRTVVAILVCLLVGLIAWMMWPPSASEEGVLVGESDEEIEAPAGPMLAGRAPPPGKVIEEEEELEETDSGPPAGELPPLDPLADDGTRQSVQAYVTDPDGRPIAGVAITNLDKAPWKSDRSGHAEIEILPSRYVVITAPEGWWHDREPLPVNGTRLDVVVRPAVTFDGTVLDPSGRSVSSTEINVEWFEEDGRHRYFPKVAVSDPEGRFRMKLPRTTGRIAVWAFAPRGSWDRVPRHRVARENIGVDELRNIELRFDLGETIEGYVVDLHGDPVLKGSVAATPIEGILRKMRSVNLEEGTGRFRFTGLDAGPHWLQFHPSGQSEGRYPWQRATAPASDVRLEPTTVASLTGRVVGEAVEGAEVVWYRRGPGNKWFSYEATQRANTDGSFELKNVGTGETRLYVHKGTRYALLENVVPRSGLEVPLHEGKSIRGRLTKPSGPHRTPHSMGASQDGLVVWRPLKGDGTFEIGPLPPGRWKLHWGGQGRTGSFDDYGDVEAGKQDVVLEYPSGH